MKFLLSSCWGIGLFLLLQQPAEKKGPDCAKFKTGTFFYEDEFDKATLYKIVRTDSMQFEAIIKTGDNISFMLKWNNPCEYEVKFLKQHVYLTDSIINSNKELILKVRIIRTDGDTCYTISKIKGDSLNSPQKGKMYLATGN